MNFHRRRDVRECDITQMGVRKGGNSIIKGAYPSLVEPVEGSIHIAHTQQFSSNGTHSGRAICAQQIVVAHCSVVICSDKEAEVESFL